MQIPGSIPSVPPLPPNFAADPVELVSKTGLNVVIVDVLPILKVRVISATGASIPFFGDMPLPVGFGKYGEF